MPQYFVSRQRYWHGGDQVVEIAEGGLQYANPDMLTDGKGIYRKLGSRCVYDDPTEALDAAIRVRDEWLKHTDEPVRIEAGFTWGFTCPFNEHPSDEALREWAAEVKQKLHDDAPKCEMCGDPIFTEDWWYIPALGTDIRFCSEYCCDRYYYEDHLDSVANEQVTLA